MKQQSFTKEDLEELIQIHKKHTGEVLSNEEALDMGTRLITLFKIIGKRISH